MDSIGVRLSLGGNRIMRSKLTLCVVLALAATAFAKDPKAYLTGQLVQMDSVPCGMVEKDSQSFAGEMLGSDPGHKKTQEVLCQEYVLQTERVMIRIRPTRREASGVAADRRVRAVSPAEGQAAADGGRLRQQGAGIFCGIDDAASRRQHG